MGIAAQFKLMKGRFRRGLIRWMARAINSLPVPVSPRINTVASVGATTSTWPITRFMAVLLPTISSKFCWTLDDFLVDILHPVAPPQVLNEGDPSERRKLQDGRGDQNRNPSSVLANQLFLKRSTGAEPQPFFVSEFVQSQVFRRREIGPVKPACLQILAAVSHQFEKRVVGLGNPVELAGNNARDGRFRGNRPETRGCAAAFRLARDGR